MYLGNGAANVTALALLSEIRELPGNARCMDCDADCAMDPWVSISHGTLICVMCAGQHRSLGVHISFVRSLKLDVLKEKEIAALRCGGNERMIAFLEGAEQCVQRHVWRELPVTLRYHTPVADLYRRRLRAQVAGDEELPMDLDASVKPPPPAQNLRRPAKWTPDNEAPKCELCHNAFSLFLRRHHCRRCGRCVCSNCSPQARHGSTDSRSNRGSEADVLGSARAVRQCKFCSHPAPQPYAGLVG
eukprot:NODE_16369_length_998_cov_3.897819.p1 GENE.NODE_16369_length_998_cov_3.897819~~NODE_16369_length_998_cov_3.897819.p1  ORF type:complete len:245 (+),score=42.93 NODE_16369_length_998_cov_3.897819:140-874(+)